MSVQRSPASFRGEVCGLHRKDEVSKAASIVSTPSKSVANFQCAPRAISNPSQNDRKGCFRARDLQGCESFQYREIRRPRHVSSVTFSCWNAAASSSAYRLRGLLLDSEGKLALSSISPSSIARITSAKDLGRRSFSWPSAGRPRASAASALPPERRFPIRRNDFRCISQSERGRYVTDLPRVDQDVTKATYRGLEPTVE